MLGFFSMTLKLCTLCPLVAGKTFAYFRPCYAKSGCAAAILSVRAFLPSQLRTAVPPSQIIWNAVVAALFRISNDPSDVEKFPSDFGKLRRALLFQKNPQFSLRSAARTCRVRKATWPSYATLPTSGSRTRRGRPGTPRGRSARRPPATWCGMGPYFISAGWRARMTSRSWRWCCRTSAGRNLSTRRTLWWAESTWTSSSPGKSSPRSTGGEVRERGVRLIVSVRSVNEPVEINTMSLPAEMHAHYCSLSPSSGQWGDWFRADGCY